MKKRIFFLSLLLALVLLMSACTLPSANVPNAGDDSETKSAQENSFYAPAFVQSESWTPVPVTKTVKILTIGNEQSVDRAQYLAPMARELGINVILGHLLLPGAALANTAGATSPENKSFAFYRFENNEWTTGSGYSMQMVLQAEKWDYIVLSETMGKAGVLEGIQGSIPEHHYLSSLAIYISYNTKVGGNVAYTPQILWDMTWAFEDTATYNDFGLYDFDQMKMYNAIVDTTKTVLDNSQVKKYVKGFIPTGTAVQNLRTSYWYDGITRDGSNLSYMGKILSSMVLLRNVIGVEIDSLTFESHEELAFAKPDLAVLKEAVNNAYAKPYEVTQSAFPRA